MTVQPITRPERIRRGLGVFLGSLALLGAVSCQDPTGSSTRAGLLWRAPLAERDQRSISVPATDGQRVYAIGGGLVALDAQTGAVAWRSRLSTYAPINVDGTGTYLAASQEPGTKSQSIRKLHLCAAVLRRAAQGLNSPRAGGAAVRRPASLPHPPAARER